MFWKEYNFFSSSSARIEEFLSPDNEETELILERCNSFARKLISQVSFDFERVDYDFSVEYTDVYNISTCYAI